MERLAEMKEEEGEKDFKNNNCRKKTNKKKVWEREKRGEKNLRGTQGPGTN